MTQGLEWTSQEQFRSQPIREWFIDGEAAGKTRRFGVLTFATIKDAGHMVRVHAAVIGMVSLSEDTCRHPMISPCGP